MPTIFILSLKIIIIIDIYILKCLAHVFYHLPCVRDNGSHLRARENVILAHEKGKTSVACERDNVWMCEKERRMLMQEVASAAHTRENIGRT